MPRRAAAPPLLPPLFTFEREITNLGSVYIFLLYIFGKNNGNTTIGTGPTGIVRKGGSVTREGRHALLYVFYSHFDKGRQCTGVHQDWKYSAMTPWKNFKTF